MPWIGSMDNPKQPFPRFVDVKISQLRPVEMGKEIQGVGRCMKENLFYLFLTREEFEQILQELDNHKNENNLNLIKPN